MKLKLWFTRHREVERNEPDTYIKWIDEAWDEAVKEDRKRNPLPKPTSRYVEYSTDYIIATDKDVQELEQHFVFGHGDHDHDWRETAPPAGGGVGTLTAPSDGRCLHMLHVADASGEGLIGTFMVRCTNLAGHTNQHTVDHKYKIVKQKNAPDPIYVFENYAIYSKEDADKALKDEHTALAQIIAEQELRLNAVRARIRKLVDLRKTFDTPADL